MTTAVILAGGLGTRLRSVVADRPKPMAEVAGRPFLEHLISYWIKQGVDRFILSTGYRSTMIRDHFGASFNGVPIDYVTEAIPLGTGGAIVKCQRQMALSSPFLLLNGDSFFAVELDSLIRCRNATNSDWIFSLFPTSNNKRYLTLNLENNGSVKIPDGIESPKHTSELRWANGGVYFVNPKALLPVISNEHSASLESDFLPYLQNLGQRFHGVKCEGTFIDIGVPEDFATAQTIPYFNSTEKRLC